MIRYYSMSITMISICGIVVSLLHTNILQQLGSMYLLHVHVCMANTNAWWSSQLLCSKLSIHTRAVMKNVSRKVRTEKFSVPSIFGRLAGIRKHLYTKITNSTFCRQQSLYLQYIIYHIWTLLFNFMIIHHATCTCSHVIMKKKSLSTCHH